MLNLEKFLEKYYKPNEKIILACSAWPDSMFLLYKILETKFKNNLIVSYFNHKTRAWTEIEENFIKNLWKELWFIVETESCDIKEINKLWISKSFEELAREKRYEFLWKIREKYKSSFILTAHHLDDKIETFFFNLARWSKLSWLINMWEKAWFLLRPLLKLKKSEILEYLDKNKLNYKIDETNSDTEITRNHLRFEIIPKFEKINKNYKENISKTLDYFENLKEFIDEEVKNFLKNNDFFVIEDFNKLPIFLQKEVIRYIYFISNWNSTIGLSEANIWEIIKFINWKNNRTIKEIKNMKMKKDNKIIIF